MQRFLWWLANSPIATACKIGAAAALAWVVGNPQALDLPPWALAAITAGVPVLVNALNPADHRYGAHTRVEPEPDVPVDLP